MTKTLELLAQLFLKIYDLMKMDQALAEKIYYFLLFSSSDRAKTREILNLLAERLKVFSDDLTDLSLYGHSFQFLKSKIDSSEFESICSKACSFLFYQSELSILDISRTLMLDKSQVISFLNLERSRIASINESVL